VALNNKAAIFMMDMDMEFRTRRPSVTAAVLSCWLLYCNNCYYAALLPRGPHIASHSVCPSVRPSRYRA